MVERVEPFTPLVKSENGRVLAISDLSFMQPPQNTSLDNDRFISNIADFLTTGERGFDLADFPHFFKGEVDILLGRASLFETGAELKRILSDATVASEIRGVEDLTRDTLYVGLYQDSPGVAQYLDGAGVQVDDTLRTPFTPDIATAGTALLLLHEGHDRRVMVLLGDQPQSLERMIFRLESGRFKDGLVGDFLGVYSVR